MKREKMSKKFNKKQIRQKQQQLSEELKKIDNKYHGKVLKDEFGIRYRGK